MRIERKEGAEAVVIRPVEEEMAEECDEGDAVEQPPANGGAGWLARICTTTAPAMKEPDGADEDGSLEWETQKGVGPSAMMLKDCDRAVEGPETIDVGHFGSEGHRHSGVGRLAVETRAG